MLQVNIVHKFNKAILYIFIHKSLKNVCSCIIFFLFLAQTVYDSKRKEIEDLKATPWYWNQFYTNMLHVKSEYIFVYTEISELLRRDVKVFTIIREYVHICVRMCKRVAREKVPLKAHPRCRFRRTHLALHECQPSTSTLSLLAGIRWIASRYGQ